MASPCLCTGIRSRSSTTARGSACLSLRARFTQNSTPRNSASACQAPRPVLSQSSEPSASCARSVEPPGPVVLPVLADPWSTYHRLSKPRWGCLVSLPAISEGRNRPSCTRMNGSVSSMLADRLGQLCDAGLVSRTVTEGPPLSVTYALTGAGRALLPALEQITRWSEQYLPR